MITVSGVSMRYGSKVLFDDVSTTFTKGRRYGLTGPNGSGKSTFMKLLTGELEPQRGTVSRPKKLGVLRQDQFAFDEFRVIDTVIMGNQRLWQALDERERLYNVADMTDAQGMRLAELEGVVGEEDGYTAESDAGSTRTGGSDERVKYGSPTGYGCRLSRGASSQSSSATTRAANSGGSTASISESAPAPCSR